MLRVELGMIDEKLCRSELSAADRAAQTARRKAIYEDLHPETKAEAFKGNRHTGSLAADNLSFTRETAKSTGKDEGTIRRDAERGETRRSRQLRPYPC
jgi:ParB family chromosome partitioning protein